MKKNIIYFISSIALLSLISTPKIKANDELDRKIDQQDFGSFYPRAESIKNDFSSVELSPNIFSRPQSSNQTFFIKGAIKIENWVDDIPEFRVLFDGQESLTDLDGFFTFSVNDSNLQKYKLIITRKIEHIVDKKNTFASLKVIPDKNCLAYSFKKLGHHNGIWIQKDKNLSRKNFVIPKNSIIILVDPKYVEKIEEWNIMLPDNFIKLPRIILKSTIECNKLKRVSAKSLLSLEDSVFHERSGRKNSSPDAKNSKVKVTLP